MTSEEAIAVLQRYHREQEEKFQREHGCSQIEYMDRCINEAFAKHGLAWVDEEVGWQPIQKVAQ